MAIRYYPAIIERGGEGYGVFFPDLDGCTSAGDTIQDAAANAEEGLQSHVELMLENGTELPDPSDFDCLPADPDVEEAARIIVRVEVPDRSRLQAGPNTL